MILATIRVEGVRAIPVVVKHVPKGIKKAKVRFEYADPMWDGLSKTVVFRAGDVTKDVLNAGELVEIPPEVVEEIGAILLVGVYGEGIPTLWADLGRIRDATDPSGDESTDPSLPVWEQLQNQIDDLKENGSPGCGGGSGENGGYYTPSVKQPDSDTLQFDFTPSKAGMPAINPVQVELPAGPKGDDYKLTEADKKEIAEMAAGMVEVPTPDSGGNVELDTTLTQSGKAADAKAVGDAIENLKLSGGGSLNLRDMEVNEIFTITGSGSGGSGDSGDSGGDDSGTITGAVAINGRIIDIDMRNVKATDEYLIDTSGNENHMKLSAIGSASKDNVWTPVYYDTTANITKYVGAYTENTIDLSGDFTVELFCEVKGTRGYFSTLAPGWTGKDYAFGIGGRNNDGTIEHIRVNFTSQSKNYYPAFDDLTAIFLSGNFYHITVTRKGNDCSLYKNGEFVQTITLTSEIPLNYRFYLSGGVNSDKTVSPSNQSGAYKMLRAYTRALSASEIANHYSIELAKG